MNLKIKYQYLDLRDNLIETSTIFYNVLNLSYYEIMQKLQIEHVNSRWNVEILKISEFESEN